VLKFIRKKWWLLIIILITLGVGGFIYLRRQNPTLSNNGGKETTYVVRPVSLKSALNLSGNVDADKKVTLQFQTSGRLAWIGVKEGDWVEQWQTIATLDQRKLKKDLEKELNDFMTSRWDYDQLKDDYEGQETDAWNKYLTDEITRIEEKSQFDLNKAIIDVELSNLSIELSNIFTPIAGIVVQVDQPIAGVNITPATARFEIVNPDTLYVRSIIDQQDIVKLRKNQRAKIIFDPFPNKTYYGQVYYQSFAPEEGEESSYIVKISFPASLATKLRLGMGAEVLITTAKKTNVLAVPLIAVSQTGKKSYVTVLNNNKRKQRQVVVGIETNDMIEIKKGLKRDEIIIY